MSAGMHIGPAMAPRPRLYLVGAMAAGLLGIAWTLLLFVPASPLPALDRDCACYWRDHESQYGAWWTTMVLFTDMGGVAAMTILTGMGALWQWSIGHRRLALAWIAIAMTGALTNQTLKTLLDRQRPPPEWRDRAVLESNLSYPSGHAMGSTIGYGMLVYALARGTVRGYRRQFATYFFGLLVLAVAASRVYLRAHWLSDVIGGFLMGFAWLCFCLWQLERRRRT